MLIRDAHMRRKLSFVDSKQPVLDDGMLTQTDKPDVLNVKIRYG